MLISARLFIGTEHDAFKMSEGYSDDGHSFKNTLFPEKTAIFPEK